MKSSGIYSTFLVCSFPQWFLKSGLKVDRPPAELQKLSQWDFVCILLKYGPCYTTPNTSRRGNPVNPNSIFLRRNFQRIVNVVERYFHPENGMLSGLWRLDQKRSHCTNRIMKCSPLNQFSFMVRRAYCGRVPASDVRKMSLLLFALLGSLLGTRFVHPRNSLPNSLKKCIFLREARYLRLQKETPVVKFVPSLLPKILTFRRIWGQTRSWLSTVWHDDLSVKKQNPANSD